MKKDKIPCTRCGVCCSNGPCGHGIEDSYGICVYLIFNNGNEQAKTSCKLILGNKIKNKDIEIGVGCILHGVSIDTYNYYHSQMIERLKNKNGD